MKRGLGLKTPLIVGILLVLVLISLIFLSVIYLKENINSSQTKTRTPLIFLSPSPPPIPSDCSDSEIKEVWDSIFIESSSGIIIKTNDTSSYHSKCDTFVAYKQNNGYFNFLIGYNKDDPLFRTNTFQVSTYHANLSDSDIQMIENIINLNINEPLGIFSIVLQTIPNFFSSNQRQSPLITLSNAYQNMSLIYNPNVLQSDINRWYFEQDPIFDIPRYNYTIENNFGSISSPSLQVSFFELHFGVSYDEMDLNGYSYLIQNCLTNYSLINSSCQQNEIRTIWYNDSSTCPIYFHNPSSQNSTSDCDFDNNGLIGNLSDIEDNFNLNFVINNASINNSIRYFGIINNSIYDGNKEIVRFDWNYSNPLNLRNISILKETSSSRDGYLIVDGLPVQKTFFVSRNKNSSQVCVKNSRIDSVNDISDDCDSSNEFFLLCPGTNSSFTCSILNNDTFQITGLYNSGVVEMAPVEVDLPCVSSWQCGSWNNCTYGNQTRSCTDLNGCQSRRTETQSCSIFIPPVICIPNWTCYNPSPKVCPKNETQYLTCFDANNCNSLSNKPSSKISCVYESSSSSWLLPVIIILTSITVLFIIIIVIIIIKANRDKKQDNFYY